MRSNQAVPGIFLLGIGIYFVTQQFNITFPYYDILFNWPTILFIIGLLFSWQGFSNREDGKMFSGIILLGLGTLFHGVHTFQYWNYEWPYFTLIVAAAFLMKHAVTKRDGAVPGMILLVISLAALFFSTVVDWLNSIHSSANIVWPFILVAAGCYLLFFRK